MSNPETIAKNTLLLSIGEIGTRALSLVLVVAIARYLGNAGLGAFAFAFAFTDLLLNFVDLGIPMYMIREIAKNKAATGMYAGNVLGLRLAMAPFVLLIGLAAAFIINTATAETRLIIILATAGMALNFLTDPFRMVFMAHQRDAYYSALIILERLIFAIGGLAMLAMGSGLVQVLGMFILSQLISLFATTYTVRKKFASFRIQLNMAFLAGTIRRSSAFWAANFMRMVYQRADTLLITAIQGLAATGLYGAAYRITEALRFIPIAVTAAVFPAMSWLHTQSKDSVRTLYERTIYYTVLVAIPMAAGLTLTADRIVLFFYGEQFAQAAIALKLLAWAEALLFIHYITGFLLGSINKQHLFTIATALYAAANIGLNIILIPKYNYIGAGMAAIATQAIAAVTLYYFAWQNGYGFNILKLVYKPGIAAGGMTVALHFLKGTHLFIAVPAAAAAYLAVLIAVRGIGKEEIGLVRKIFFKKQLTQP